MKFTKEVGEEILLAIRRRLKDKPIGPCSVCGSPGASKTVSYADTSTVKKASSGVSAKTWIILGAAAVGAAVTWVLVKPVLCDGGAQTRGPC